MSRSSKFSNDLCSELRQKIRTHCWVTEWKPIKRSRESVDVVGFPNEGSTPRYAILVEAELRRGDPASNIIKIWRWWTERKDARDFSCRNVKIAIPRKLLFFQAFSRVYRLKKRPNMKKKAGDAKFVGELFEKQAYGVKYIYLPFDYHPYKGAHQGGGARKRAARRLSKMIRAHWRRIQREKPGNEKKPK